MTSEVIKQWMVLTGGLIPEVEQGFSQDAVARFLDHWKGPDDFLDALFTSLTGKRLKSDWALVSKEVLEDNGLTAKVRLSVRRGTDDPEVGLAGRIVEWERTTAHPVTYEWESFGLPNMLLLWQYDYHKWGQLGYCEFRHRELKVLFRTETVVGTFRDLWKRMYCREPEWTSEEVLTV